VSIKPRVIITRKIPAACEAEAQKLFDAVVNRDDVPLTSAELQEALRTADALLPTVTDKITTEVLAAAPRRAKIIANFGVGFNNIDITAAKAQGLTVTNTPDVLTDDTADIAMTLLLMVARRAGEGERHVRNRQWTGWRPTHMLGAKVSGKTLGLVGFGRIAKAVARRAHHGFGMKIIFSDPYPPSADEAKSLGAELRPSAEAVLREAEFVSLHCPATAETRTAPHEVATDPSHVSVPVVIETASQARAPEAFAHAGTSRPSLWQSFRAWWQAERIARENERRARAAAEAAAKMQELQALQPASSAEHVQAIRSVMTLTEERFQALGLRSDRLHDELVGISRALAEIRATASDGTITLSSLEAADDLQERLDALLLALAEEFRRRSEEIERSLSAQMTIQNAELAMLLEDALVRMRSLIPEVMAKVAAEVSETVERAVAALPPPVSVFGPAPREDAERLADK